MTGKPVQRKLILYMSMSLDGFAARRDGTMEWLGDAQAHGAHRQRAVAELLGPDRPAGARRAGPAQDMAQAWPGSQSPTGELMNALPKVVFSEHAHASSSGATRASATGRSRRRSPSSSASRARTSSSSAAPSFARSLAAHGLIDEYRINVQPVALGDGLPLLHGLPEPLRLDAGRQHRLGRRARSPTPTCRAERAGEDAPWHVICDMSMSLDGYVTGPNDSRENPFGDGAGMLHDWLSDAATDEDRAILQEMLDSVGAVVMGRTSFDKNEGDGGWGDGGPVGDTPCFVVTHHAPAASHPPVYTFVTDGVASAIEQAKEVAGDKVVGLHGATVMQQALPLGLVDEIRVHVIPVLLGGGTPLFARLDSAITLERTSVLATPAATHLGFRVA